MFLLPLGLGSKLPSQPAMCLILSGVIGLISISQFKSLRDREEIVEKRWVPALIEPQLNFFYELCSLRLRSMEFCQLAMSHAIEQNQKELRGRPDLKDKLDKMADTNSKRKSRLPTSTANGTPAGLLQLGVKAQAVREEFLVLRRDPSSTQDPRVRELPAFASFLSVHKSFTSELERDARNRGLATKSNLGFFALLKAQFIHQGWMHLIGNLVILIFLGIYLEARTGPLEFLSVFLISGLAGIGGHLYFFGTPWAACLGASGGVSGVMGAFLAFFWREPMKVWVSYLFVVNRRIYIPSFWVLGALFIATDVTSSLTGGDNVAHEAHIMGLVIGFGLGLLHKRLWRLPEGILYPDEQLLTEKLPGIPLAPRRQEVAAKILSWNRNNLSAMKAYVAAAIETRSFHPEVYDQATSFIAVAIKRGQSKLALDLIGMIPLELILAPFIEKLSLQNRLALAKAALSGGNVLTAFRLYDSVLRKFRRPDLHAQVLKSVEQIYSAMHGNEELKLQVQNLPLHADLKTKLFV